jgi:hypothetical protein
MTSPIALIWNGEAFEPANKFWARKCDERFVVGQNYSMDEIHQRSQASHAHYFATLHDIWQSLPEHMQEQFPTEEHMRKYALIRTGYHTMTQHVCKSNAEADRMAAAIKPYDAYQLVTVKDSIVTVYHALSQDLRSMNKGQFLKSKQDVLDWCGDLIGAEGRTAA